MKKFADTIRWILTTILFLLTFILIIGGAVISSASLTVTNPENPKAWLNEGRVYENAVQFGISRLFIELGDLSEGQSIESMSRGLTTEEDAKEIADRVFPPEWVQSQAEPFIDSIYAFLNDETENLEFKIDLTEANERAKAELASVFKERLDSLPECNQGSEVSMNNLNIFESDCLPTDADKQVLYQKIDTTVQKISFFKRDSLTEKDVDIKTDDFKQVKPIFSLFKSAPLLLLFLALLLNYLILFLTPKFKNKLKTSGYLWGTGGLALLIISLVAKLQFSSLFSNLIVKSIPPEQIAAIDLIRAPLKLAYGDFTNYILYIGSGALVAGLLLVIGGKISK